MAKKRNRRKNRPSGYSAKPAAVSPTETVETLDDAPDLDAICELEPAHLAAFSEEELRTLAKRIKDIPRGAGRRTQALEEDPVGKALLEQAGSADAVCDPVIAVWGEEAA